jgi:hypothetical protein
MTGDRHLFGISTIPLDLAPGLAPVDEIWIGT